MNRNAPAKSFWKCVKVGPARECWPFLNATDKRGYGKLRFKGKSERAHRVAYTIAKKRPKGRCVLHRCDNPPCCNPAHLFLGTRRDNVADRHRKGRDGASRGERHYCARLKTKDVLEIRESKAMGKNLAKKYAVTPQQISRIKNRQTWRHI